MLAKSPRSALDQLAAEFRECLGRPVATTQDAAMLLGRSVPAIRQALYRGDLTGSRPARNGPVYFTCRELARYFMDGERRSLPVPEKGDRDA